MSSWDYVALEPEQPRPACLNSPKYGLRSLALLFLCSCGLLAKRVISHVRVPFFEEKPKAGSGGELSEVPFVPIKGIGSVVVKPNSPGPLQMWTASSTEDVCVFAYHDFSSLLRQNEEIMDGVTVDKWTGALPVARLYGVIANSTVAKTGENTPFIYVTGNSDDALDGELFCWRTKLYDALDGELFCWRTNGREKLLAADRSLGYLRLKPLGPDRTLVSVVLKDGRTQPAYTYTYYKPPAFVCHKCQIEFGSALQLKEHDDKLHWQRPTPPKRYKSCDSCGLRFDTLWELRLHQQSHASTNPKPWMCQECKQDFGTANALRAHNEQKHNLTETFPCSVCNMEFLSPSDLAFHQEIHKDFKPFSCPHCGKNFSVSGNLKTHIRTHTGEKPYECPTCDKAFVASNDLKKHLRTHTREKPYNCTWCSISFSQSGHLTRHLKNVHRPNRTRGSKQNATQA
eukprot:g51212.t1